MKNLKKYLLNMAASVVTLVAFTGVGTACFLFSYEPKPPADLLRK